MLDADNLELPYWMFRFDEMVDIIYAGRKPNPDESDALYEVIRSAKTRFSAASAASRESSIRRQSASESGWISADTPVPYRISDAVQIIDEWMGKLDPRYARADMRALQHRLEALSHDPRYRFMFGKLMVEDIIAKVRRADLPHADGRRAGDDRANSRACRTRSSIPSFRCWRAWRSRSRSGATAATRSRCSARRRIATFPPTRRKGFEPTRRAIGRIAKEGRKYGVSLGVVTQRPSELDPTVLSQCSTMFAMRLANERDKDDHRRGGRRLLGGHDQLPVLDRRPRGDRLRRSDRDADADEIRRLPSIRGRPRRFGAGAGRRTRTRRGTSCARSSDGCAANTRATSRASQA